MTAFYEEMNNRCICAFMKSLRNTHRKTIRKEFVRKYHMRTNSLFKVEKSKNVTNWEMCA